jgi:hypothetical protein
VPLWVLELGFDGPLRNPDAEILKNPVPPKAGTLAAPDPPLPADVFAALAESFPAEIQQVFSAFVDAQLANPLSFDEQSRLIQEYRKTIEHITGGEVPIDAFCLGDLGVLQAAIATCVCFMHHFPVSPKHLAAAEAGCGGTRPPFAYQTN